MDNCIFCKIIKGEIPSYKIYENEYVFAFLDIADDIYGHTLVVPKKHFANVLETNQKYLNEVMKAVKKISKHYVEDLKFDRVNLLNINEDVQHFHIHILPRKKDDKRAIYPSLKKENNNLEEVCKFLKIKQ